MRNLLLATSALTFTVALAFAQTATVSTTEVGLTGFNFTSAAQNASVTNYFKNDGRTLALIKNQQAAVVTATLVTEATTVRSDGYGTIPLSDQAVTIPAGSTMLIGPFGQNRWGGLTRVNLTSSTLVSISTVRVPK